MVIARRNPTALRGKFPGELKTSIERPPRSPDLTPLDSSLWGCLKVHVHVDLPTSVEDVVARFHAALTKLLPAFYWKFLWETLTSTVKRAAVVSNAGCRCHRRTVLITEWLNLTHCPCCVWVQPYVILPRLTVTCISKTKPRTMFFSNIRCVFLKKTHRTTKGLYAFSSTLCRGQVAIHSCGRSLYE